MKKPLIAIQFALITLSLMARPSQRVGQAGAVYATGRGQTNSQWNTMGDETGWLTTSKDSGGGGPRKG